MQHGVALPVLAMRIKSVQLRDYRRFTELTICDLPPTARLVVLVGPNGEGKSSVLDSFLLRGSKVDRNNYNLTGDRAEYYDKSSPSDGTQGVARKVQIEVHDQPEKTVSWATVFHIRSAYRDEPDFRSTSVK